MVIEAIKDAELNTIQVLDVTATQGVLFSQWYNLKCLRPYTSFKALGFVSLRMEPLECGFPPMPTCRLEDLISRMLARLPRLEHLFIATTSCSRGCCRDDGTSLDIAMFLFLTGRTFRRLVSLGVEGSQVYAESLSGFVRKNKRLRRLEFRKCCLMDGKEESACAAIKAGTGLDDVQTDMFMEKMYRES
ncbi:hypothetical protein M409DRAFT_61373 [Zasmidium cellare ATCC 36951]|uniref:Uncharacterized protein n=1 Tax=Zasmidium cellare ATCC 36951 TaxID=1080233 RepID=A0A6A6BZE2_ZASCE|nr:uncharacterized protein M409DRAFT_61373 [Zasmidium cellare ATCC 36951]KAF2158786.1 hypothetical protein M409DRAFT_61373 [Zasmidium cellare ATCC 36951]